MTEISLAFQHVLIWKPGEWRRYDRGMDCAHLLADKLHGYHEKNDTGVRSIIAKLLTCILIRWDWIFPFFSFFDYLVLVYIFMTVIFIRGFFSLKKFLYHCVPWEVNVCVVIKIIHRFTSLRIIKTICYNSATTRLM